MSRQREYRAWPKVLDEQGLLDGKTIGIVRVDSTEQQEAVEEGLVPGLEALGHEVAAISVLPCPEGSAAAGCEQHDVAIQRLQDAGVDSPRSRSPAPPRSRPRPTSASSPNGRRSATT